MELTKVCAYCRVSTDKEEQETSFKNQQVYFERELSKEKGFELISIYADEGLSGTDFRKRDQFNNMMYDAGLDIQNFKANKNSIENKNITTFYTANEFREPLFKYIYVKNSSRFARNIDVMRTLRVLKSKGVYVHFLDVNKTTENQADEMLLQMLFMLDENDSKDKSRKIKFGANETAKAGKIRVGYELFGYTYNKVENSLRIIEEEANIIRLIYNLAEEGKGSRQIVNILRDKGIRTRRGVEFRHNVILRMLQNPTYTGKVVRNKWDNGELFVDYSKKMKDRSEWIVQQSEKVDEIISNEQFERVQKLIKKRTNSASSKGVYKGRSEFAGKIKCNKCGNYYTKNIETKNGRVFYNCGLKKSKGVHNCNSRNVSQDEIEKVISSWIQDGYLKSWLNLHIKKLLSDFDEVKNEIIYKYNNRKKFNRQDELDKLAHDLEDLIEKYLDASDIMKKVLDNKIKEIEIKIKELENEKSISESKEEDIESNLEKLDMAKAIMIKTIEEVKASITREEFIENYLYEFIIIDGEIKVVLKLHYNIMVWKALLIGSPLNNQDSKNDALKTYQYVES
jgi:DNA invertase Pin-like site-specific DNA recombinase